MLAATVLVLGLLPAYVAGQLMSTDAKCLPGYEWTFNSLNQSPCDVGASLAAVCAPNGQFNLDPLPSGYVYSGPRSEYATPCRCSTVYYSLTSACGYCQSRNFIDWSDYSFNCSTVYVQVYPRTIPSGVNVPAWAYLNVVIGDGFNVTLARQTTGTESSRPPNAPPTSAITSIAGPSSSVNPTSPNSQSNVGAIVGGVIGGLVGLALLIALITFLVRRNRSATSKTAQHPEFPTPQYANSNMGPAMTQAHTGDGSAYFTPQSPFAQSVTTNITGNSARPMPATGYTYTPEV